MYRWTDPIEPEGVSRRPEPPTDEGPAWLTDRPEPRSSYLFGDEPAPAAPEPADAPTGVWRAGSPDAPWRTAPGVDDTARHEPVADLDRYRPTADPDRYGPATDPYRHAPAAGSGRPGPATDADRYGPAADRPTAERAYPTWAPVADVPPTPGWVQAADEPAGDSGRHRQKRRIPRPLLIGGAAAAATLVVSLGVGALVLPGDDGRTDPTAAEGAIAAAPEAPGGSDTGPGDALAPSSVAPTPSSLRPSPSRTATPKPSRTTAPSRQLPRSTAPNGPAARAATTAGVSAELQQVVDLVNKERAKAGCKALGIDDKLMLAAQRHSQDQADHKTMSHDGSDGSDVGDRLDRVGYAWRAYGENVAWNQQTPAAVMDAWMNSPGHRANILNCSFTEIGVGVARSNGPYWTQDFGTPR
ncbi:CAP domain-containing protein [Micromonospora auratinigra]|uniref:Uncharacterized conserved protein YkwD, contains CAP (CSP/antigen 5/PR1) domain n=1 Tax=Micromonospora auratinigra TaxID=261654 RepID=A0A1A9AAB1_9ACTN|nr:CAP domain-containing protein [Micromonospora auratinigra]SBT53134.1 Uncharacterized conserved protein YkwD, contains CAP (CSP/antigen 5/PR1) domain [Micromonospora auratinigra]